MRGWRDGQRLFSERNFSVTCKGVATGRSEAQTRRSDDTNAAPSWAPSALLPFIHKGEEAEEHMPDAAWAAPRDWAAGFVASPRLKKGSLQLHKKNMF